MAEEKLNDQAIFEAARRIDSHEARATYLQQSCGEESDLHLRVELEGVLRVDGPESQRA